MRNFILAGTLCGVLAGLGAIPSWAQAPQAGADELNSCQGFRTAYERGELDGFMMFEGNGAGAPVFVGETLHLLTCYFYDDVAARGPTFTSSDASVLGVSVASEAHRRSFGVSAFYLALTGQGIGTSTLTALAGGVPDWAVPIAVDALPPTGEITPPRTRFDVPAPPIEPILTLSGQILIATAANGGRLSARVSHAAVSVEALRVNNQTTDRLAPGLNRVEVDLRVDPALVLGDDVFAVHLEATNARGQQSRRFGAQVDLFAAPRLALSGFTETELPLEFEQTWEGYQARIALTMTRDEVSRPLDLEVQLEGTAWEDGTLRYYVFGCNRPGHRQIRLARGESCRLDLEYRPDAPGALAPAANLIRLNGAAQGPIEIRLTGEALPVRRLKVQTYGTPNDGEDSLYFGDVARGASTTRRIDLVNTSNPAAGAVSVNIGMEDPESDFWIVGGPRTISIEPGDTYLFRVGYTANGAFGSDHVLIRDTVQDEMPAALRFDRDILVGARVKEMQVRLRVAVPPGENQLPLDVTCLIGQRSMPAYDGGPDVLRVDLTAETSNADVHNRTVSADGWVLSACSGLEGGVENIQLDPDCVTTETTLLPRGEARFQINAACPSPRRGIPEISFNTVVIFSYEARDFRGAGNHLPYPSFELWVDDIGNSSDTPELLYSYAADPLGVIPPGERIAFSFPGGGILGRLEDGVGDVGGIRLDPPRLNLE